jgi:hypothetical protein
MRFFFFWVAIIFCALCQKNLDAAQKKYDLSICAIFKNEAKYLREWIEYHRLIGVDHFYLYNTGSTDPYRQRLKEYVRRGIVTLVEWPDMTGYPEDAMWALGIQLPAYENAIHYLAKDQTKWLVFVDIDEFLLPIEGNNLADLIEKYQQYPGIVLPKMCFDASRSDYFSSNKLVVEANKLSHSPDGNPLRTFERIIFKPELCTYFTYPPYTFIFKDDATPAYLSQTEVRINQYFNRNVRSFNPKSIKGTMHVDYRTYEWERNQWIEDGYELEEHSIDRFVPILYKKMGL